MRFLALAVLLPKVNSLVLNGPFLKPKHARNCGLLCSNGIHWNSADSIKLKDAYLDAASYLDGNGVPEADISARMMLCDITKIGYRMSDFNNNQEIVLTAANLSQLSEYCRLRNNRTPLQYVIGNWDFYGFTVLCKPPVLIPRPETEELVEKILNSNLLQNLKRSVRILDVGAGTGVIGIALLSQLSTATCDALDINEVAVTLATRNSELVLREDSHRYNCRLQSFMDFAVSEDSFGLYDIIVSNPPYIPSEDLKRLEPEVVKFEDSVALDGGEDGLDMVRDLILNTQKLLNPTGTRELWIEVSDTHPSVIEEWMQTEGAHSDAFEFIEGIVDFAGNPRFVRLRAKVA